MRTEILSKLTLAALLVSLGCGPLRAQPNAAADSGAPATSFEAEVAAEAPDVIFSNLTAGPDGRYDTTSYSAYPIVGRKVLSQTESWYAMAFIPKKDGQATMLLAPIGYVSGTRLVTLGLYSDNKESVGTLLPGGEGSTSRIPDLDTSYRLVKVRLPGKGVTLRAGTRYWLVAGPDNTNGATFYGKWYRSNQRFAGFSPPYPWQVEPGQWLAAEIRGTYVANTESRNPDRSSSAPKSASNAIIFTNLQRMAMDRYRAGAGVLVTGNDVLVEPEIWEALPFTPKSDVHAISLSAAIGYDSGTKKVNLGIYSDSSGTVGSLLSGGQGSTTDIPDTGDCCELTTVTLPGAGVSLTGGIQYWLVASPDNVNAPDFQGEWQTSALAVSAYQQPERGISWTSFDPVWLAAEIRGTQP